MSRSWRLTLVFSLNKFGNNGFSVFCQVFCYKDFVAVIFQFLFSTENFILCYPCFNLQIIWSLLFLFGRPFGWDRSISSDVIVTRIFSQMLITADSVSVFDSSVPGLGTLWNLRDVPYCSRLSRLYSRSSTLCCDSDLLFFSVSISSFCSSSSFAVIWLNWLVVGCNFRRWVEFEGQLLQLWEV